METKAETETTSHLPEQVLTDGFLKSLQIFYFVFGIGALLLLFFVLFQTLSTPDIPVAVDDMVVRMLSVVHLVYGLAGYVLAPLLFRRVLGRGITKRNPDRVAKAIRNAYIMRLTLFEGVAYFGLVILLIAAMDGVLALFPQYWLNLLSTLVLLVFLPATFPTRERVHLELQAQHSVH